MSLLRTFSYIRNQVKTWVFGIALLIIALPLATCAAEGQNRSINYQARLRNSAGVNVADGTYAIKFSIYTTSTGGIPVWTANGTTVSPTAVNVTVSEGLFSILLGDTTAGQNPFAFDWNQDSLFLGVTIAADAEMTPRKRFSSVPSAFVAETLQGQYASSSVPSTGGTLFNLRQGSNDAASGVRTVLNLTTFGASDLNDYLVRANSGGADVFSINRLGNVTTTGNLAVQGMVTLGDASSDLIRLNGNIASDITPSADLTYSLGSVTNRWLGIVAGSVTSTNVSTTNLQAATGNVNTLNVGTQSVSTLTVANNFTVSGATSLQGLSATTATFDGVTSTAIAFTSASGSQIFASSIQVNGSSVCLANGTNCQVGSVTSSIWQENAINNTVFLSSSTRDLLLGGNTTATAGFIFDSQSSPGTSTVLFGGSTNTNVFIGTTTYGGGLNSAFVMDGNDVLAQGQIGSVGGLFSATGVRVGGANGTTYGDGFIAKSTSGDFIFSLSNQASSYKFTNGSNVTSTLALTSSSRVGIGTDQPVEALDVVGNIRDLISADRPPQAIATTTVGAGPVGIAVSGRYAYTSNASANSISVVDISNPAAPSLVVATLTVGTFPVGLMASGRYLYVANASSNNISTVDISNPASPVVVATTTVGINPEALFISGHYIYVTNHGNGSNSMSVLDIANPSSPVVVSATTTVGQQPLGIYVQGKYAYVVNQSSNSISVVDVSNPAAPILVSATTTVGVFPYDIYVNGRYAYVSNGVSNSISVVDISNPNSPVVVSATTTVGFRPQFMAFSGRYLYVDNNFGGNMSIVDISNPTVPVVVITSSTVAGLNPEGIVIQGHYAYLVNFTSNAMITIALPGIETASLLAHAAELGALQVETNGYIGNQLSIGGGLIVGSGGILSQGSLAVGSTNTTSTFIFSVSTTNLEVSNRLTVGGRAVCLSNGTNCPTVSGVLTESATSNTVFLVTSTRDVLFGGNVSATAGFIFDAQSSPGTSTLFIGRSTNTNLLIGASTYSGGLNSGFNLSGNDLFAQGMIGSIEGLFSATGVRVGTGTVIGDTSFFRGAGANYLFNLGTNTSTYRFEVAGSDILSVSGTKVRIGSSQTSGTGLAIQGNITQEFAPNAFENNRTDIQTSSPDAVVVRNGYAFVVSSAGNTLSVFRMSSSGTSDVQSMPTIRGEQVAMIPVPFAPESIAITGSYAYIPQYGTNTINIVDISDPANPVSVATTTVDFSLKVITIVGRYAYVGGDAGALYVLDLGSPLAPNVVGSVTGISSVYGLVVRGRYAFTTDPAGGGQVNTINISNPLNPFVVSSIIGSGFPYGITMADRFLYVADAQGFLDIFDAATATALTLINTVTLPAGCDGRSIAVSGRYLAVGCDSGTSLTIYDLSNPRVPSQIESNTYASGAFHGLTFDGRYLYAAGNAASPDGRLSVFPIFGIDYAAAKIGALEAGSLKVTTDANIENNLFVGGGISLIGSLFTQGGLTVAASNTTSTFAGSISVAGGISVGGVEALGGNLSISPGYGAGGTNLSTGFFQATTMVVQGRYAYMTSRSGTSDFGVIDMRNDSLPILVGHLHFPLTVSFQDLQVVGSYAYALDMSGRMFVFDVSNPSTPVTVATTTFVTTASPHSLNIQGRYAYVANVGNNTISVLDLVNPLSPQFVGTTTFANNIGPFSVAAQGRYLYLSNTTGTSINVLDLTNPTAPVVVGSTTITGVRPGRIAVRGGYLYALNVSTDTLSVVSIENPVAPSLSGTVNIGAFGGLGDGYPLLAGKYVHTPSGKIVDVTDPSNPFIAVVGTGLNPGFGAIHGRYLVKSDLSGNVTSIPLNGIEAPAANFGTLSASDLQIDTNGAVAGKFTIGSGLSVDGGGIISQGSLAVSSTNTTSTFVGSVSSSVMEVSLRLTVGGRSVCLSNGANCPTLSGVLTESSTSNTIFAVTSTRDFLLGGNTSATAGFIFDSQSTPGTSTILIGGSTNTNVLVGTTTYGGGLNSAFVLDGGNVFVQGSIGSLGGMFSATGVTVGTGTTVYADSRIYKTNAGDFRFNVNSSSSSFRFFTSSTERLTIASSGNLGIGISNPMTAIDASGTIQSILHVGQNFNRVGSVNVGNLQNSVTVSGRYAYVGTVTGLNIVDVTNPSAPVNISTTTYSTPTGCGGVTVAVSGRYAYLANCSGLTTSTFIVVDVSSPASPVTVTSTHISESPTYVFVSGHYAYLANGGFGRLDIVDITDPARPTLIGTKTVGTSPRSIYVSGRYAYTTDDQSGNLTILDVSNPANPVTVTTTQVIAGGATWSVFVSGRYAYVTDVNNSKLGIVDISNAANPVTVTTTLVGNSPSSVFVSGRYAYVANEGAGSLSILDVAVPASPVLMASPVVASSPIAAVVSGRYAYIADDGTNILSVIDIGGIETNGLIAHSAEVGSLQVLTNGQVANQFSINGGLDVGPNGIYSQGSLSIFTSSTVTSTSIYNTASNTNAVLDVRGGCSDGNVNADLIVAGNNTDTRKFSVRCNGNVFADGSFTGGGADFAEYFHLSSDLQPTDAVPGSVVALSTGSTSSIELATDASRHRVLGVISSDPAFVGNGSAAKRNDTSYVVVGLMGQVPTRVSTSNGPIQAGDLLALSATPGVVVKAVSAGYVIGMAQEPYDQGGVGTIDVYIRPTWYQGDLSLNGTSTTTIINNTTASPILKGLAVIRAGASDVQVMFNSIQAYPIIMVQPYVLPAGRWGISDVSDVGFTIRLSEPTTLDTTFSWTVDAAKTGERIYYSDSASYMYDPLTGSPIMSLPTMDQDQGNGFENTSSTTSG